MSESPLRPLPPEERARMGWSEWERDVAHRGAAERWAPSVDAVQAAAMIQSARGRMQTIRHYLASGMTADARALGWSEEQEAATKLQAACRGSLTRLGLNGSQRSRISDVLLTLCWRIAPGLEGALIARLVNLSSCLALEMPPALSLLASIDRSGTSRGTGSDAGFTMHATPPPAGAAGLRGAPSLCHVSLSLPASLPTVLPPASMSSVVAGLPSTTANAAFSAWTVEKAVSHLSSVVAPFVLGPEPALGA